MGVKSSCFQSFIFMSWGCTSMNHFTMEPVHFRPVVNSLMRSAVGSLLRSTPVSQSKASPHGMHESRSLSDLSI